MTKPFLYFDMGNVLLFFDHRRAARQIAAEAQVAVDTVEEVIFRSSLLADYERGALTTTQFHQAFETQARTTIGLAALETALNDIFVPNYSLWGVIAALKQAGYRLGILSNTCAAHVEYVTRRYTGLFRGTFDVIGLSYELHAMKPELSIYQQATAAAGVAPEQIIYGDDIAGHVVGARAAGWDAVVFENTRQYARELRARGIAFNY